MNVSITDDLVREATELLENWARSKNLLPNGKQLVVSMSVKDVPPVTLEIEDEKSSDYLDNLLSQSVEMLEFNWQVLKVFTNIYVNIDLVGDLVRTSEERLCLLRGFGKKSLMQVKGQLAAAGLSLGMACPVGPREREAALQKSLLSRIPSWEYEALATHAKKLGTAGIVSAKDFLSKTEDEITVILSSDALGSGKPHPAYRGLRNVLLQRGLI